ncbi:hypothetical protein Fot_39624 [Forsythia ovata]|uniref:Uncharacterized protein n=1 Tax=Forsythia ovata TaxID=205694 RepID=A0ABD1S565_9LAMI
MEGLQKYNELRNSKVISILETELIDSAKDLEDGKLIEVHICQDENTSHAPVLISIMEEVIDTNLYQDYIGNSIQVNGKVNYIGYTRILILTIRYISNFDSLEFSTLDSIKFMDFTSSFMVESLLSLNSSTIGLDYDPTFMASGSIGYGGCAATP